MRSSKSKFPIFTLTAGLAMTLCGCEQNATTRFSALAAEEAPHLLADYETRSELNEFSGRAHGCFASETSVIAVPQAAVELSGNANVAGSLTLLDRSQLRISGNSRIGGGILRDFNVEIRVSGKPQLGRVVAGDLSAWEHAAEELEAYALSQVASRKLDRIEGSFVLSGEPGINVVEIEHDIELAGKNSLILQGDASTVFILNVRGSIRVSGQASILLRGGVLARNVLFNNFGGGREVSLSGQGSIAGTFLALERGVAVSGSGEFLGMILAGRHVRISGNGQILKPAGFCVEEPAPEPSPEPSSSPTPTPSETVVPEPTPSPSETVVPEPTPSPSETVVPEPTPSPTETVVADPSPTPTAEPSPSATPCVGLTCGGGVIGI
ncbi:MAG: ice-binding family protein [Oligoflexia bacterium]|nr:ice-binding family protein [Oligoflexia bacterium]